jgi:excisionase family DNA binding protein
MLSPKDVAEECGLRPRAIYNAVSDGELPAYRLRGRLRITRPDLDAWIAKNRVQPSDVPTLTPRTVPARDGLRRLLDSADAAD